MNQEHAYADDYPTCGSTYASLLGYHDLAIHRDVTVALDLEPTMYVDRERGRWTSAGGWREKNRDLRWNVWSLDSEADVEARDALRHLDWILARLDGKGDDLARLRTAGWSPKVSVFWQSASGHGGPRLIPVTMKGLVALELSIDFDIYASHPSDADLADEE